MTLFIACILIFQFNLHPLLYVLAVLIWAIRVAWTVRLDMSTHQAIEDATRAAKEAARLAGNLQGQLISN